MRANTINTNIIGVEAQEKQEVSVGNPLERKCLSASAASVEQLVAKWGVQDSQRYSRSRATRIEMLKAQVESETYHVDSLALAERVLVDETHFLDEM